MNGNGINAYKQANVITADPRRLIILCYETVINNIKMARECYISKDYETKAKCRSGPRDAIINYQGFPEVIRFFNSLCSREIW